MKKTLLILSLIILSLTLPAQNLIVGSYNIRYDNDGDKKNGNGWEQRCPVQIELIRFYEFDVLGTQEVLHNQLNDLLAGLSEYDYVGVGRDDGKTEGEYAPIFYKRNKIKKMKSGHFWLAEQTDRPNKGWDAVLPRICTWAQLQDRKTKKKFWFFNLHMDHVGVKARSESAKLVLTKIKEMCKNEPIILTGDFNVDQTHDSYAVLHDSGIFEDTFESAKIRYALNGTFNAFDANLKTDSRIDHVFVSPIFTVKKYGVLTDTYRSPKESSKSIQTGDFPKEVSFKDYEARIASDHFPILVELSF